jgi:hypothetical protein
VHRARQRLLRVRILVSHPIRLRHVPIGKGGEGAACKSIDWLACLERHHHTLQNAADTLYHSSHALRVFVPVPIFDVSTALTIKSRGYLPLPGWIGQLDAVPRPPVGRKRKLLETEANALVYRLLHQSRWPRGLELIQVSTSPCNAGKLHPSHRTRQCAWRNHRHHAPVRFTRARQCACHISTHLSASACLSTQVERGQALLGSHCGYEVAVLLEPAPPSPLVIIAEGVLQLLQAPAGAGEESSGPRRGTADDAEPQPLGATLLRRPHPRHACSPGAVLRRTRAHPPPRMQARFPRPQRQATARPR